MPLDLSAVVLVVIQSMATRKWIGEIKTKVEDRKLEDRKLKYTTVFITVYQFTIVNTTVCCSIH